MDAIALDKMTYGLVNENVVRQHYSENEVMRGKHILTDSHDVKIETCSKVNEESEDVKGLRVEHANLGGADVVIREVRFYIFKPSDVEGDVVREQLQEVLNAEIRVDFKTLLIVLNYVTEAGEVLTDFVFISLVRSTKNVKVLITLAKDV